MLIPSTCSAIGEYECQTPMPLNGRRQDIDICIADLVAALNAANVRTTSSCCGHGDDNLSVIFLEDGRELRIKNVKGQLSQAVCPKLRDNQMQIEGREITAENNYLDPVTYIPAHANGKASHPACEQGVIIGVTKEAVRVLYCKSRTVQATNPCDLVWG